MKSEMDLKGSSLVEFSYFEIPAPIACLYCSASVPLHQIVHCIFQMLLEDAVISHHLRKPTNYLESSI